MSKEQTRQLILETALAMAKDLGWSEVSVRKISSRIGFSTIMIYSFFGSKENLFKELRDLGFKKLLRLYNQKMGDELKSADSVRKMTLLTLDFYYENKQLYQIMFGITGIQGVGDLCSDHEESGRVAEFAKNVLKSSVAGNPDSLFFNWWALIHGFISIKATMQDKGAPFIEPYLKEALERFIG